MTRIYHAWPYGRFIEIKSNLRGKKFHTTTLSSNFLGDSLSNRDNVRAPIKFKRESQPQHLKRLFFLKNRPIYFHINSTSVIRPIKQNQLSFFSIEINKRLPVPAQCLTDQIQGQKPILAATTDQMPDLIYSREQYHQDRQQYYG